MGNPLAVQWLGLGTFTAKGTNSISGQGTKISQAAQPKQLIFKITKFLYGKDGIMTEFKGKLLYPLIIFC